MPHVASTQTSTPPSSFIAPFDDMHNVRSQDRIGQFTYGPTTQTTVTTVTTEITTELPPFRIAPPRLQDLDLKDFPLADSPTPHAIRKLEFDVNGKRTTFQEAEDTMGTLQKVTYNVLGSCGSLKLTSLAE